MSEWLGFLLGLLVPITHGCGLFLPNEGGEGQPCLSENLCRGELICVAGTCQPRDPLCTKDGWCWANPLPQGNTLHDVWIDEHGDLWAVGDNGTILRRTADGYALQDLSGVLPAQGKPNLYGIWGSSATSIWAVGQDETILHWDGERWSVQPAPTIYYAEPDLVDLLDVHGSSGTQVYAVGERMTALRLGAGGWKIDGGLTLFGNTKYPLPYRAVACVDETDIWVVGDPIYFGSNLYHWDGASWTAQPVREGETTPMPSLYGVQATRSRVWVAGTTGVEGRVYVLDRSPGSGDFLKQEIGSGSVILNGVSVTDEGEVWIVGERAGGRPAAFLGTEIGTSWLFAPAGFDEGGSPLLAVAGSGSTAWGVGADGVIFSLTRTNDGPRAQAQYQTLTTNDLHAVHGLDPQNVWAVGRCDGILRWEGKQWAKIDSDLDCARPDTVLQDVAVVAAKPSPREALWVVSDSQIHGPSGSTPWCAPECYDLGCLLGRISALSAEASFAIGNAAIFSTAFLWKCGACAFDEEFQTESAIGYSFDGVFAVDESNVVVVGLGGYVGVKREGVWTLSRPGEYQPMSSLWCRDMGSCWAVGKTCAYHFDTELLPVDETETILAAVTGSLRAVWGVGGDTGVDMVAVGDSGTILERGPTAWRGVDSGTAKNLTDIWGGPDREGGRLWFAVGAAGTILVHRK